MNRVISITVAEGLTIISQCLMFKLFNLFINIIKFTSQISDFTKIYEIFIRSILVNSCVEWYMVQQLS